MAAFDDLDTKEKLSVEIGLCWCYNIFNVKYDEERTGNDA